MKEPTWLTPVLISCATGFVCSLAAFVNMRCEPQTGSQIGAGSQIGSIS